MALFEFGGIQSSIRRSCCPLENSSTSVDEEIVPWLLVLLSNSLFRRYVPDSTLFCLLFKQLKRRLRKKHAMITNAASNKPMGTGQIELKIEESRIKLRLHCVCAFVSSSNLLWHRYKARKEEEQLRQASWKNLTIIPKNQLSEQCDLPVLVISKKELYWPRLNDNRYFLFWGWLLHSYLFNCYKWRQLVLGISPSASKCTSCSNSVAISHSSHVGLW